MQHSILVVDDEKDIVDSLERQFRKQYRILKATSGHEALKILNREPVSLILSDQRMPEMTGVQLFERAQKLQPNAIRILLTGYTDVESVIAAINMGQIYRYVTKPWDPTDLDIIIKRALESFELRSELKEKNQKLELALEELKGLDRAKSLFMILIGHELKTPLTTISSYLDLLKEEVSDKEAQKYIQRINQGTVRLNEIIFDVLDLLGAETGQLNLNKRKKQLAPIVDNVLEEFNELGKKKSVQMTAAGTKVEAHFDSAIVEKVLRKILHNALKFADEKSEIKIVCKTDADKIEVAVVNHGTPIPASKIEQILQPFNLNEDIMHHSQGMGLGLSVCQSLLKHHGSRLTVQSSPKETRVSFALER